MPFGQSQIFSYIYIYKCSARKKSKHPPVACPSKMDESGFNLLQHV